MTGDDYCRCRLIFVENPALPAPPTRRETCPLCAGQRRVRLTAFMLSRECPTCRGLGSVVITPNTSGLEGWPVQETDR